jgi:glycosyltransferase involved in cell wall biosynthesis
MLRLLERSKLRRLMLFVEQRESFEAFCYIATRLGMRLPAVRRRPRPAAPLRPTSSGPRIRLVACVHSLALEGAPLSLIEILIGLTRTGRFDIQLLCAEEGPLVDRVRSAGIVVHLIPAPQDGAGGERAYEASIDSYARSLVALEPDLVLANSLVSFHAIDAARVAGIRSMWLIREADAPNRFVEKYPRAVQSRALACLDYPARIVFASRATMNAWPRGTVASRLIRTVPDLASIGILGRWNRADARRSLELNDRDVVALCVGTVCDNKGQSDLIAAVARCGGRVRAVLVGAPAAPGGAAVMRAVKRQSDNGWIRSNPPTPDIGRFYAAADIYVCCSRSESYPRTILEALAFGLPIVTTLVGGIQEALGRTQAMSYAPGDATALREALLRLTATPALRSQMAASSRTRWEEIQHQPSTAAAYAAEIAGVLAT